MKQKFVGDKGKVGEWIYPHYNGTASFWKRTRWDLVMEVDKDGKILHIRHIWDHSTVAAIQIMQFFLGMSLLKQPGEEAKA